MIPFAVIAVLLLCVAFTDGCITAIPETSKLVSHSWQSSSLKSAGNCGLGRTGSPSTYFHSAVGSAAADLGYHWLAVRLKMQLTLAAVAIRGGGREGLAEDFSSRSKDIEVWTSSRELDFGPEECESRRISSVFGGSLNSWISCGTTGRVQTDGSVKARCAESRQTRMILLRKNVANESIFARQCMSFSSMTFYVLGNVTVEFQPSKLVNQSSSVNVICQPHDCADGTAGQIQLCHVTNKSCFPKGILINRINRVQSMHSGNYTCSVDDEALSIGSLDVLYPPSQLQISVNHSSCSAVSPDVIFEFESSAAEPVPHHLCSAVNSLGSEMVLTRIGEAADGDSNVINSSKFSSWVCQNCRNSTANVTVQCWAAQLGQSGPLWNSTTQSSMSFMIEKYCSGRSRLYMQILCAAAPSVITAIILIAALICAKCSAASPRTDSSPSSTMLASPQTVALLDRRAAAAPGLPPRQDESPPPKPPRPEQLFAPSETGTGLGAQVSKSVNDLSLASCSDPTSSTANRRAPPHATSDADAYSEVSLYLDIVADGERVVPGADELDEDA